ncbi:hypothetical protein AMS68_000232 [Peltaster fructicola]|uniref:Translation initiation factor eIF2B subunit delta n=1 Tax=Peltaster fructicola TaxID=286661 RepID=A0A6H0XJB0_9PEZI|nr:hypothetical protein AMS68_000232 [Peltaster fructicola]
MSAASTVAETAKTAEDKLSPAELKKRAKAEKQARRAAQKEQSGASDNAPSSSTAPSDNAGPPTTEPRQKQAPRKAPEQESAQDKRKESGSQRATLPTRRRLSHGAQKDAPVKIKREEKRVELFSHLYSQPRRHTLESTPKDIHPAVIAVGLQMSTYAICGSTARCVAMLLAFKEAILSYNTPVGTSLARHLTSHYLSPQIEYLKSCRPISESMGNAIRYLKKRIIEIDPSVDDHVAKNGLCEDIDNFIRERITITDQAIAETASKQIKNGSVVLTYAKSSLVEKTILQALADGIKFSVIIVDSRPLHEGKALARSLMQYGLQVKYVPLSGAAHAVKEASTVLLGAHSMLSNGRLQSRIGTATVAMLARKADVPVIVCCGSIKFSGKVALDSIVLNEVAPSEELLIDEASTQSSDNEKTIHAWRDIQNLQILNLMYDITPAEYIRMVICEYGSLPSSSVPVVHRLANEGD